MSSIISETEYSTARALLTLDIVTPNNQNMSSNHNNYTDTDIDREINECQVQKKKRELSETEKKLFMEEMRLYEEESNCKLIKEAVDESYKKIFCKFYNSLLKNIKNYSIKIQLNLNNTDNLKNSDIMKEYIKTFQLKYKNECPFIIMTSLCLNFHEQITNKYKDLYQLYIDYKKWVLEPGYHNFLLDNNEEYILNTIKFNRSVLDYIDDLPINLCPEPEKIAYVITSYLIEDNIKLFHPGTFSYFRIIQLNTNENPYSSIHKIHLCPRVVFSFNYVKCIDSSNEEIVRDYIENAFNRTYIHMYWDIFLLTKKYAEEIISNQLPHYQLSKLIDNINIIIKIKDYSYCLKCFQLYYYLTTRGLYRNSENINDDSKRQTDKIKSDYLKYINNEYRTKVHKLNLLKCSSAIQDYIYNLNSKIIIQAAHIVTITLIDDFINNKFSVVFLDDLEKKVKQHIFKDFRSKK